MSFESEQEPQKEQNEDQSNQLSYSKEFEKIITDFVDDIENSFEEYRNVITTYYIHNEVESKLNTQLLFDHVMREFPEKFFDILYQNEELFEKKEDNKKELLPNIDFVELWNLDGITDTIKDKIWKYLQIVLFSVVSHVKSNESFGDTAKLFEAINETEFRDKLEDTIKNMSKMFEDLDINIDSEDEKDDEEGDDNNKKEERKNMFNKSNLPDADELHKHISEMMDGKLGKLATEIAEETAADLDIDVNNINSEEDVFKKLFKNPTKLMGLVKKVGGKLDSKIKSGDIKESELMDEASELMKKMKDMPGMDNLQNLFKGMNIPGMGKKARFNTAAFERMQKEQENKKKMMERARKRAEEKRSMNEQLEELKKQFENMTPEEVEKRDKALMELIQEEEKEEEKNKMDKLKNNNKKKKKKKTKK
jgi:hypothetical protein